MRYEAEYNYYKMVQKYEEKLWDLSSRYMNISNGGNLLKLATALAKMSASRNSHVYTNLNPTFYTA